MNAENTKTCDVLIMGSGLGGAMLGAVLARQGVNTIMVEAGTHPRFAIGEATTPDTSFKYKILAEKYEVPEINNLAAFYDLKDKVSPACGVKRHFSFLYQREGEEQNPVECHQFPTLSPPLGPDVHFFRQDTDAYMANVATRYGARLLTRTKVEDIDLRPDGVTASCEGAGRIEAKFLVDATGFRSPLVNKVGARADNGEMLTNSRSIFTHMTNVKLYDQVGGHRVKDYGISYPHCQGTLHHVFEGGWFWVIPFNNHVDATNPICSVGLMLNREIYPETGKDPEEEFFEFVNKFSSMRRQFEGATSVRPWVSTPRIQYAPKTTAGDRFALLAHSAGFVDPLYSSGLLLTAFTIDDLVPVLLESVRKNEFRQENFSHLTEAFLKRLDFYDRLVGASFVAFRNFDLWDAWYRIWVVSNFVGTAINLSLFFRYKGLGRTELLESQKEPYNVPMGIGLKAHIDFFNRSFETVMAVERKELAAEEAAERIRGEIKDLDYFPSFFQWHRRDVRSLPSFGLITVTRVYLWYLFFAPKRVRHYIMRFKLWRLYLYALKSVLANNRLARLRKWVYIRDLLKANNGDFVSDWRPIK